MLSQMLSTFPAQVGEAFSKWILKLFYWAPQMVLSFSDFCLFVLKTSFLKNLESLSPGLREWLIWCPIYKHLSSLKMHWSWAEVLVLLFLSHWTFSQQEPYRSLFHWSVNSWVKHIRLSVAHWSHLGQTDCLALRSFTTPSPQPQPLPLQFFPYSQPNLSTFAKQACKKLAC